MIKNYLFFSRNVLPQPQAHLVQAANAANGAANLGYPTILVYLQKPELINLRDWLIPFHPRTPSQELSEFYNLQERLQVLPLAMPNFKDRWNSKFTDPSTIVCKYYLPLFLRPYTQIVHTRDWNFVKAAIKNGVPAIYEHHHHEHKKFEPEIVKHPLFQISVTVADSIRESMIANGMPPEKVITLHNGFNRIFLERNQEAAESWRRKLLSQGQEKLVVYSGGLTRFKGVDLLIDVAKMLPQVQFALAGGDEAKVQEYQKMIQEKQVENVTLVGYLRHNQLAGLLQAADALAHPHGDNAEASFTSPLKLFDYMASGTPIVATDILPLKEFKGTKAIAGWCEPDNPVAFAQCLQQILEAYPHREEGYLGSIDYVNQYSWESRAAKILSYVDESLRPEKIA